MWDQEKLFTKGDDYFDSLLKDIDAACVSIEIEVYIFRFDGLGNKLLGKLGQAVSRGVRVRLHIDGAGSQEWTAKRVQEVQSLGINVKVYRSIEGWVLRILRRWPHHKPLFRYNNRRNHRKIFLIDSTVAYVGSFNVTDEHLESAYGKNAWIDLGVRLTGAELVHLQYVFERLWSRWRWDQEGPDLPRSLVRLNDTRESRKNLILDLIRRVRSAQKRVWIVTPYFVPHSSILKAIQLTAWSGVDIRVIVPRKSDVRVMPWLARMFFPKLLQFQVRIFEVPDRFLHAKMIFIDDWIVLGSSNLNHRSFFLDFEVDVKLTRESEISEAEEFVRSLMDRSDEVHFETMGRLGFFRWLMAKWLMRLRYWL